MIRMVLAAAAVALGVTSVVAQDPVSERREAMKQLGAQQRAIVQMIRGDVPFDAAKAQAALGTIADVASKAPDLFATKAITGDSSASPKIWEDMDGFKAGFTQLETAAKSAQAAVTDVASLKAELPAVVKNCAACHEAYRVKR